MVFKEREINNLTFLRGYFVLIFHFENAHYININRSFKVKTKTKLSLSRMSIYLFRVPYKCRNSCCMLTR
jgi:hypothetical protein